MFHRDRERAQVGPRELSGEESHLLCLLSALSEARRPVLSSAARIIKMPLIGRFYQLPAVVVQGSQLVPRCSCGKLLEGL